MSAQPRSQKGRCSSSEFAVRNPRAVVDALEQAARATWRELHRQRAKIRGRLGQGMTGSWLTEYATERAKHEAETLRLLLAIRRGSW